MSKRLCAVLLILNVSILFSDQAKAPTGPLPKNVLPQSYELSLRIFPDQDRFSGLTKIQIEIKEELSVLWIHGKDLHVIESGIKLANGKNLSVKYKQVEEGGVVRIDFPEKIKPQRATLWFRYDAAFDRKLESLYRVDQDGNSYAFTQFEAISARRCFPGFDEPAFKTPFHISLIVHKQDEAITNTLPIHEELLPDGTKKIRYRVTEKLPTYLLVFAVGPFDVVNGPEIPANEFRKEPVPLRGIAVKGKGNEFTYSLANTGAIVTQLEKYFGRAYPFPKLDLIAVPDFEWGAMENAGAITFRDSFLLFDEKTAPFAQKKSFANVMAHELGHQWFGNLVTMRWWDDIWLNEGLTSWIDGKIVQEWDPTFKADVSAVDSVIRVMNVDSTDSTHPVHRPVQSSEEIASIADSIIFTKGAALPLMYEHYLGEKTFQKVIRRYIKDHEFSVASSEDLLESVRQVAGNKASESFRSFLFQPGVPRVEVEKICEGGTAHARVRQSRYLPLGSKAEAEGLWQIPLCTRMELKGKLSEKCSMVSKEEAIVPLSEDGCPDWIMPNAAATGYYRWSLSSEGFAELRQKGYEKLTAQEQLSVVDSVKSAFGAGRLSVSDTLETLAPFARSSSPDLAMQPASTLTDIRSNLLEESQMASFEQYSRRLYRPVYEQLGFDAGAADSDEKKEFRAKVIEFLAFVARDPEVRKRAADRGRKYTGFGTDGKIHAGAVDPNVLPTALGVAVQEYGSKYVDALISILKNSKDSLLRRRILVALGKSADPAIGEKVRSLAFDPALRTNEILVPIDAQFETDENREAAWRWLKENISTLIPRLSLSESGSMSFGLLARFCSEDREAEIKEVLTDRVKDLPGGPAYLKRTLDYIHVCSARLEAHRASVNAYFQNSLHSAP